MKSILILAFSCILQCHIYAQFVANGNFNTGTTSWGCNAETNLESVYGGPSATNSVAEVDAEAGLCQTITGLSVGAYYRLTFQCSRRTNCGPTLQSMNVSMSGGIMNSNISRNGTAFSLASESIFFVPTSTSHTLTFTGTTVETCNLLVDNVVITVFSALPVELSAFDAVCSNNKVLVNWTTESEIRTNYFTVESSRDGASWIPEAQVDGQFNSQIRTEYFYELDNAASGLKYYRLRLTDIDGTTEVLSLVSLNCENEDVLIFPNPTKGILNVNGSAKEFMGVFDSSGRKVSEVISVLNKNRFEIDLSDFSAGVYCLQIGDKRYKLIKE